MRAVLVSSCTNRKKLTPSRALQAHTLGKSSLESLAAEWQKRLAATERKVSVHSLYAGRAFTEVLAAAELTRGGCYIVSAGLGLISTEDEVPSYSLTVSGKDRDNILSRVAGTRPRAAAWWGALTRSRAKKRPLSALIESASDRLVILAMPSSYIELVSDDLATLPAPAAKRVRVIGLPSLRKFLPQAVADSLIPYDERFEAAKLGLAGTRSDFPQRAARHFVASILPQAVSGDARLHAGLVAKALGNYSRPKVPRRERHSDEMMKELIGRMWVETEGRVTSGLRLLRRKKRIACEQSRFKRLFWEVAAEKGVER